MKADAAEKVAPAAKFVVDQRVRMTESYAADIERITGLTVPEGCRTGTVFWTFFDEEVRGEGRDLDPRWMYGVRWDLSGSCGIYEDDIVSL